MRSKIHALRRFDPLFVEPFVGTLSDQGYGSVRQRIQAARLRKIRIISPDEPSVLVHGCTEAIDRPVIPEDKDVSVAVGRHAVHDRFRIIVHLVETAVCLVVEIQAFVGGSDPDAAQGVFGEGGEIDLVEPFRFQYFYTLVFRMEDDGGMVGEADQNRTVRQRLDQGRVAGIVVEQVGDLADRSVRFHPHDHGAGPHGIDMSVAADRPDPDIGQFETLLEGQASVRPGGEQFQGPGCAGMAAEQDVTVRSGGQGGDVHVRQTPEILDGSELFAFLVERRDPAA